jgi:AraC-like DNA-binding protein
MAGVRPRSDVPYAGTGEGLAMQVISALMADPADDTDLAAWAERLHVSTRTLQRDFTRHVGSTWSAWRTQHRLEASVAMLDLYPVTTVAHLVGYATASAYVAAFRRYFGTTPGRALLTQPHVPDVARSA